MAKAKGRASRGPRGRRGLPGAPGISPAAVDQIIETLEQLRADAEIQFKRIAQIQAQLDATLKALKEMAQEAGRLQRKKR